MKITFLGTGAPEGNPSPFCDCVNCRYVRRYKGNNIRTQASLLVNDDLLIDFGPEVKVNFNKLALPMSRLKYILVTHCHFDHFYPNNLYHRLIGPRTTKLQKLTILGPVMVKKQSRDWLSKPGEQSVLFKAIEPFQEILLDKYKIITFAITQNDKFAGKGMGYIIILGRKTMLYVVDTYRLPAESWKVLNKHFFDIVIFDETFGFKVPPAKDHHNIPIFLETMDQMKKLGLINIKTKIYTQHMSHHNPPHDQLVPLMAQKHIFVPYDGQIIYVK